VLEISLIGVVVMAEEFPKPDWRASAEGMSRLVEKN
jgi:hypothetical protein